MGGGGGGTRQSSPSSSHMRAATDVGLPGSTRPSGKEVGFQPQLCAPSAFPKVGARSNPSLRRRREITRPVTKARPRESRRSRSLQEFSPRTDMHTHGLTHIYTHMQAHTQTYTQGHARVHTHRHARTHAHSHTCTYTRTHELTHICTHTHVRTYTRARTCTHARTRTYTRARAHNLHYHEGLEPLACTLT